MPPTNALQAVDIPTIAIADLDLEDFTEPGVPEPCAVDPVLIFSEKSTNSTLAVPPITIPINAPNFALDLLPGFTSILVTLANGTAYLRPVGLRSHRVSTPIAASVPVGRCSAIEGAVMRRRSPASRVSCF